jgi:glutamate--cysteine ligase
MRVGEKPAAAHRCGIEAEKLGVRPDGSPVQILGPGGVSELLRAMAADSGERLLEENGAAIGIQGANASVALEPGGQLELSGAPSASLMDLARELADHHAQVRTHSAARGLSWIAAGYRPFGVRAQVPWLPRGRYGLMRERLPGRLAHDMMQMTASVQANFDFSDEQDLAEKVSARLKKGEIAGSTVTLKLKTPDFRLRTRARALPQPTHLAGRIFEAARELLNKEAKGERFRLIGVGLSDLLEADAVEADFFSGEARRLSGEKAVRASGPRTRCRDPFQ